MLSRLILVFVSLLLSATSYGNIVYEWDVQNDLREEEEIWVKSFCKAYERFSPEELGLQPGADVKAWLKGCFEGNRHRVQESSGENKNKKRKVHRVRAVENGKLLGFAFFKETDCQDEIYLWVIAVDPDYGRQGIGERLVFSIGHLFPETKKMVLMTRKINEVARKFYLEKCGFKQCDYVLEDLSPEHYVGYEWQGDIKKKLEEIELVKKELG